MTKLALDGLTAPDHTLEEIFESPTIVPRRIGFCGNRVSRNVYCGNRITDQDVEAVEIEVEGRKTYCCSSCVESLLFPAIRERTTEDSRRLKTPEIKVRDFQRRPSKVEREI